MRQLLRVNSKATSTICLSHIALPEGGEITGTAIWTLHSALKEANRI